MPNKAITYFKLLHILPHEKKICLVYSIKIICQIHSILALILSSRLSKSEGTKWSALWNKNWLKVIFLNESKLRPGFAARYNGQCKLAGQMRTNNDEIQAVSLVKNLWSIFLHHTHTVDYGATVSSSNTLVYQRNNLTSSSSRYRSIDASLPSRACFALEKNKRLRSSDTGLRVEQISMLSLLLLANMSFDQILIPPHRTQKLLLTITAQTVGFSWSFWGFLRFATHNQSLRTTFNTTDDYYAHVQ